jgi:hypothetical protein
MDAAQEQPESSREKFIEQYAPIRLAFDNFLRGGKRIEAGDTRERVADIVGEILDPPIGMWHRRHYPYYLREIGIRPLGEQTPIILSVKTEGYRKPYSEEIESSWLFVTLSSDLEDTLVEAHLPPLNQLQQHESLFIQFIPLPDRVSALIPYLTEAK